MLVAKTGRGFPICVLALLDEWDALVHIRIHCGRVVSHVLEILHVQMRQKRQMPKVKGLTTPFSALVDAANRLNVPNLGGHFLPRGLEAHVDALRRGEEAHQVKVLFDG